MAKPGVTPGTSVSFMKTPQAKDDLYSSASTGLDEDSTSPILLDVLGNDLGGKGKSLYSLDDGSSPADLLGRDSARSAATSADRSANGATIWITADGKIGYDPSTLSSAFRAQLQALAPGETLADTFTYAIQLGNGTLSWATVTVQLSGSSANQAPVVTSAAQAGAVQEDLTLSVSGQVTAADPEGGALQYALSGSGTGSFGSLSVNAANGEWTYILDNAAANVQALAAGESHQEIFTIRVTDDQGAFAEQQVTITVTGSNDAPVIAVVSDTGAAREDLVVSASGQLTAADVDTGSALAWSVDGGGAGSYGSLAVDGSGAWTYTLANGSPAVQALAQGESVSESFTVRVTDEHGASDEQVVTLAIAGTNDAPVITGGDTTGAVQEDGTLTASGALSGEDIDHGAVLAWSATGGAPGAGTGYVFGDIDYTFTVDEFEVTKNGGALFSDDFGDGNPPPSGGVFATNGNPASYSVSGVFSESGGRLVMDDSGAGPTFAHLFTSIPYLGHFASLNTNISSSPLEMGSGLKSDDDFTVKARFDLTLPDESSEAYGIRLTDFISSGPNAHPGDDVMELVVRRGDDGQVRVQFLERDFSAGTTTPYAAVLLNAPVGADQIALKLSHAAANPGVVTASFEYLAGGVVVGAHSFGPTGQIFGTETPGDASDDEVWTRAQIITYSPGEVVSSSIAGVYGTLEIDQNGQWTYHLDNGSAVVQALAQGETATDSFTVRLLDQFGGFDTETVNVAVNGANDAPEIAVVSDTGAAREDLVVSASGQLTAADVDTGSALAWSVDGGGAGSYGSLAVDGSGAWTYTLANGSAAVQGLAQGQSVSESFTVRVTDEHGASDEQVVTLAIAGTNDAPVIEVVSSHGAVTEDGVASASGQLQASDVDFGAFLRWSVDGGTTIPTAGYEFRMHDFEVARNGITIFADFFNDGVAPPSAPNFTNNTPAQYFPTGGFSETGGQLILSGTAAVPVIGIGTPDPFVGTLAILGTNINPTDFERGLKSDDNFSVEGRFDLTLPEGARQAYGIRLTDRLLGSSGTPPDQAGDDLIDLVVIRGLDGVVRVQLIEFDVVADTSTRLGSVVLNPASPEAHIVLRLDHSAANPGVVQASFAVEENGVVTQSAILPGIGHIFGAETPGDPSDDEVWTRAQIVAWAPAEQGGTLVGAHGTLTVETDGTWTYALNNAASNVQALAEGEHATDTFTVRVTDEFGASDSEVVTIDITGTNDAPVINAIVAAGFAFEDGPQVALGQLGAHDVDNQHTLTWSIDGGGQGAYGTLELVNQEGSWSYTLDNASAQGLAAGQQVTETFTVRVTDEHGASDTQAVTVTVTGSNDAPVIAVVSDAGSVREDVAVTASGQLTAADVDTGAALAWSVDGGGAGSYGSLAVDGSGAWTYTLANGSPAVQALAQGESVSESFTVRVTDEHGASDEQVVTLAIAGTNDAPVITGGDTTGAVQEDGTLMASGALSGEDIDHGAVLAWSATGGAPGAGTGYVFGDIDYTFTVDEFEVTKNGGALFSDDFGDGNPPPSGGVFATNGNPASYSVSGVFSESGGRLVMDDSGAGPTFAHLFTSIPYLGHFATLNTDISTNPVPGLKSDDDFTVKARFDLTLPDESGEAYGIRLTDFISSGPNAHPGDDVMELVVRRGDDGQVRVQFLERDFAAGTTTPYAAVLLNAPLGADQIALKLSHAAANPGVVSASFDYLSAGVVVGSHSFGPTGQIFGTETPGDASDDEVWTLAQILTYSPGEVVSSSIAGVYGTLEIDQNGQWTYHLDNGSAAVQALAQGETATDSFSVRLLDQFGGFDTETVNVAVSGANDAPVITGGDTSGAVQEDGMLVASGALDVVDVDHGAILAWSASGGAPGAGTGYSFGSIDYTFEVDQFEVSKNGLAPIFFSDDFNDGNPPPSGSTFFNGTTANYFTSGVFSESGGRLVMDDSGAGPTFAHLFTSIPFLGHFASLATDASTNMATGLKSDDDFQVKARFDLALPDENAEAYGIRLTDFISSGDQHPGDDVMELVVRQGDDGQVRVQFLERDFAAGTTTPYAAVLLNAPAGADQIALMLSHAKANPGVVTASFEYLAGGVVVGTHTFGPTGQIFGTETPGDPADDEVWTRAQIIAYSPGEVTGSSIAGVYGTLEIDQNGQWTYQLNNGTANVQALAAGQEAIDTFTVRVLDEFGGFDTETISVTVTGTNDAPITVDDSLATSEDTPVTVSAATLLANDTDVDAGDTKTLVEVHSGPHGAVSLVDGMVTFTPEPDYSGPSSFTYVVEDSAGGRSTGTVNVAISAMNDAPEIFLPLGSGAPTFSTIDMPGSPYSLALDINNNGVIVGQGQNVGWRRESDGTFTTISFPDANITSANALNDVGLTVGYYEPFSSTPRYGFLESEGFFAPVNYAPFESTTIFGINDTAAWVGSLYNYGGNIYVGYLEANGTLTILDPAGSNDTSATGINDLGQVVGHMRTASGMRGFLYENGTFTTLAAPAGAVDVFAEDINDFGAVSGWYVDASGQQHGYVLQNGIVTTIDNPLGVNGTVAQGINDQGQIVGWYTDAAGTNHGFLASVGGGLSTDEDTPYTITGISVADVDSGTDPLTSTFSVLHGTLSLASTAGLTVTGMGTGTLSVTGAQGDINAALAPGLTYTPDADFNGTDSLTVTANDLGHNGAGIALSDSETLDIQVNPVDDPVTTSDGPATLVASQYFGGAGSQYGYAIDYYDGKVYVGGNDSTSFSGRNGSSLALKYDTALTSGPEWNVRWPLSGPTDSYPLREKFLGVEAGADGVRFAGTTWTHPVDPGGREEKVMLANFNPADGAVMSAGTQTMFSYGGVENWNDVRAVTEGGNTYYYTAGFGQPLSWAAYVIGKYDATGTLVSKATDSKVGVTFSGNMPSTGASSGADIVSLNGEVFLAGTTGWAFEDAGTSRPALWRYDSSLTLQDRYRDATTDGGLLAATTDGNEIFAVGYAFTPGNNNSNDFLAQKYSETGQLLWSNRFGSSGLDYLTDVVSMGSRIFAVGYGNTAAGSQPDAVLFELDAADGSVLSSQSFGTASQYEAFHSITTDGSSLYIAGESGSGASVGNLAGQSDAWVLRFDLGQTITGTASNDVLTGGNAADTLNGAGGNDVLTGGLGSDTFKLQPNGGHDVVTDFAAGVGGDKLDISDLLVGYSPGTSVLADYLQLAPAGGDTVVSVDRDGGGSTYSSQAVATLQGVTGLLLNDLEANGNLVVA